ncbi:MAG: ABC transporter substrate-binding protein [Chloroflexi bacterium]|nr:ABC transporter substrate-binding protein [Chloroflexota bacterium]
MAQLTRSDHEVHTEGLIDVKIDEKTNKMELVPQLAESWDRPDPKTIIFKLRKGVKFHDGSGWNAEVAKWNLLRMRDHPMSLTKDAVREVTSVDTVDDYTIKVNLKEPSAAALWSMSMATSRAPMISKETVEKQGEEYLATHIVGTGPFQLVEWRAGDRMIFKKFPNYWQKGVDGQPKPYLDGVELRFIADSAVARIELSTGNTQFQNAIQPRDIPTLKANPDLVVKKWEGRGDLKVMALSAKTGPFKDNLKLRQAAQYAIDRQAMVNALGQGAGALPETMIFKGQTGYREDLPVYKYDLNKAKQLLAEAGYPNGADTTLTIIGREPDRPQSEIIKNMLDKAGIRTTIEVLERVAWSAKVRTFSLEAMTYSVGGGVDSYVTLQRRMACAGASNFPGWCNPQFEAALKDSELSTSEQQRGEALQRADKIAYDDAYFVHLWVLEDYVAYNKKLHGLVPYAEVMPFWADLWME